MAKKKIKDFKTMKLDALKTELIANRKVLFENNFKHKMGQLKESHTLKEARRKAWNAQKNVNKKRIWLQSKWSA